MKTSKTTTYEIRIWAGNLWAGDGRCDYRYGRNESGEETVYATIRDCAAVLGEEVYEAIEDAIAQMDVPDEGWIEVDGLTYSWRLTLCD